MQSSTEIVGMEAELQVRLPNGRIKCTACARLCEIPEGRTGLCGIRGVSNNGCVETMPYSQSFVRV